MGGGNCGQCCTNTDAGCDFFVGENKDGDRQSQMQYTQDQKIQNGYNPIASQKNNRRNGSVSNSKEFRSSQNGRFLMEPNKITSYENNQNMNMVTNDGATSATMSPKTPQQKLYSNIDSRVLGKIIRFQAIVRGRIQRQKYKLQKEDEMQIKHTQYFKSDELFETVNRGQRYNPRTQILKKTIQYQTTGATYEGEMRGGFRHGFGKMTWQDGASYNGQWCDGFAQGQGTFNHKDGDTYEGEWQNNKCFGSGKLINNKGATYVGKWRNDLQHGQGVEIWPDGSRYEGSYEFGQKHGFGKYNWADGAHYSGNWFQNKIGGIGQYIWADGRKYYGQWLANDMSGFGIYIYVDGVTYEGQFIDDKKTGFGHYTWTDGREYLGWWYRGKQHGVGKFKNKEKNTEKYGLWEQGKRLQWFDEQMIFGINQQRYDYTQSFKDQQSINCIMPNATFEPPQGFQEQISEIKTMFNL